MKIAIASDHAGFSLKQDMVKIQDYIWQDLGPFSEEPRDYPLMVQQLIPWVVNQKCTFGVLICGSGIGMSIAANRYKGVRAALCLNEEMAMLARKHNDANVLVLGARLMPTQLAFKILHAFVSTPFEGGRHLRRVQLCDNL